MTRIKQGAFNAGIISEGMYAREDTEKFQKGLKDALNVILRPQGGVSNRAGFMTVTGIDTSSGGVPQVLIPFSFNTEQSYQLEFTGGVFRVIKEGAYVLDTAVGAKPVSAVTAANPAQITLTSGGDLASFPVGSLAYLLAPNGDHALHETIVEVTAASGSNLTVAGSDGTAYDTSVSDWGTLGAGATLQKVYQQAHGYAAEHLSQIRFAQDADTMFLTHELYPPADLTRTAHDAWVLQDTNFGNFATPPTMADELSFTRTINNATKADPVRITMVGAGIISEGRPIKITGVGGMTQLNGKNYLTKNVSGNQFDLYNTDGTPVDGTEYGTYTSGGSIDPSESIAKQGPDVVPTELVTYEYAVSAIDAATGEESRPGTTVSVDNDLQYRGSVNTIFWQHAPTAERFNVFRKSAGTFGYIGSTTAATFADENITPDTSRGPRVARVPFAAPGEYPAIVTFYEQRLAYGRTLDDPQLVEVSRIDSVKSFDTSYPSLPDDAFRFRLRAQQVNEVRAFIPTEVLAILTSGAEWEIAAQGDGEYQRPDKRKLTPTTYFGSYDIEPVLLGSTALFVETSGNVIRDYRLGDRSTPPGDLTILARDLFEDATITSWTYARSPHGVLWVTLASGELLSMTYVVEHDVWGWTRHAVGGVDAKVRQVSSIREGSADAVYAVVERTIGGRTVFLTERMAQREDLDVTLAYFVDGGLRLSYGADTSVVRGLTHLRGEAVTVLVDGDVYIDEYTIDDTGTLDMGVVSGRNISVGLSYESLLETLDVNFDVRGSGSTEGTYRATSEVNVKLSRSRGVEVGTHIDRMTEPKEWNAGMIGGPIPLRSGTEVLGVDGDWVRNATVLVRQRNPLPMTITAITPDWEFGG